VSAGPSGVSGFLCSIDRDPLHSASGNRKQLPIDGSGVHSVRCNAANNAADSTGDVARSPAETRVAKIDETPPSSVFESQNPSDPEQLIVDTTDAGSGVAGGSVQMRAAGGQWQTLPTTASPGARRSTSPDSPKAATSPPTEHWCASGSATASVRDPRRQGARHRQRDILDRLHVRAGVSSIHRRNRFQVASLPTGDYAYAPARSRAMSVAVGGHPPGRRRHRRLVHHHHVRHHIAKHKKQASKR
jgi:hypothetical protein